MKNSKGITLIALIITIIVMLILVAVTITVAVNGGLFEHAGQAAGETKNVIAEENALASGRIKIGDTWYDSPQDYVDGKPSADQTGTSGGESEIPQEPATGTHTWEKYSFNITFIALGGGGNIGWIHKNYTAMNTENVVRYAHVNFVNNNSFSVTDEWTGNYTDWMTNEYKNYPFGIIDNFSYTYCGGCCTTNTLNTRGLGVFSPCEYLGMDYFSQDVAIYPEGLIIQSTSKGSYKYGEVTSDDSTAYPTDGFKDGYWYVYKSAQ